LPDTVEAKRQMAIGVGAAEWWKHAFGQRGEGPGSRMQWRTKWREMKRSAGASAPFRLAAEAQEARDGSKRSGTPCTRRGHRVRHWAAQQNGDL